ncbi:MAG: ATP-binding protein [Anaerolineae bacterium]|nr:ATP-binding protein [Anaerolineae bacterium]
MSFKKVVVFPAKLENLAAIDALIKSTAELAGLDARSIYAIRVATEEACSNIIRHAYQGIEDGTIECGCYSNMDSFTLVFRDSGHVFDLTGVPSPDLDSCLEDRKAGGLGVYFIKQLMDEVSFEHIPGTGNVLTLVKYLTPDSEKSST